MTLVVNLFGGPGMGKSTTAAGVFYNLKTWGVNCELITEYAKSKVWEESFKTLENQLYILGKQSHRQFVCKDDVDVMITDAPILMSLYYGNDQSNYFKGLVKETFNSYDNINYLIERDNSIKYNPKGRTQTEEEASNVHQGIKHVLLDNYIPYTTILRNEKHDHAKVIANEIFNELRKGD